MAASMAKIANHQKDEALYEACLSIWENITQKKMYITGGVGSTVHGEAFTGDYDLPNDTMYCETCASIAFVYFAFELYKIEQKAEYFEVIERALYNGILSGASVDGKHFFYVNPLEIQRASCHKNPGKGHVKTQRPDWLGCACCPPNFARLIGSIEKYIYLEETDTVWINLFIGSELLLSDAHLVQQTDYPFENQVQLTYQGVQRTIKIRIPDYLTNLQIQGVNDYQLVDNYMIFVATDGITVTLNFEQPILSIISNPKVSSNVNKLSIQRGPFIYCAESLDNEPELQQYYLNEGDIIHGTINETSEIIGKTLRMTVPAKKIIEWSEEKLYKYYQPCAVEEKQLQLIPYHLWGNRGETEMRVWLNRGN